MNKENDILLTGDEALPEEPKDWTKAVWLGVLVLLIGMMFYFYWMRAPKPVVTMVRARHILISFDASDPVERGRAYERISELRNRLLAGESFERLARENSDDTMSARRGGDLNWMPRGSFATAFEEYCWKGDIGQISDVIQTEFGFHIIRIDDRHIAPADLYELEIEQKAFEMLRGQHTPTNESETVTP